MTITFRRFQAAGGVIQKRKINDIKEVSSKTFLLYTTTCQFVP